MRFMAMASVVCASRLIEPKLMAPVEKRLTISDGRLDLVQRDRRVGRLQPHQAADGQQPLGLLVDAAAKARYASGRLPRTACWSFADRLRRPGVRLAAQAPGVLAADVEHGLVDRIVAIGVAVAAHALLGDLRQAHALDGRGGAGEVLLDQLRRQADRVEDLGAAIGLVGGDAHLGHHLQHALADRLDVVLADLVGGLRQAVLDAELLQGLEREVGVHRLRAIAGQARRNGAPRAPRRSR